MARIFKHPSGKKLKQYQVQKHMEERLLNPVTFLQCIEIMSTTTYTCSQRCVTCRQKGATDVFGWDLASTQFWCEIVSKVCSEKINLKGNSNRQSVKTIPYLNNAKWCKMQNDHTKFWIKGHFASFRTLVQNMACCAGKNLKNVFSNRSASKWLRSPQIQIGSERTFVVWSHPQQLRAGRRYPNCLKVQKI